MDGLAPLVISIAPEIGPWLFGPQAAATTQAVARVVQAVAGTSDEATAEAVVARSPQLSGELRVRLAEIAASAEQVARQGEFDRLASRVTEAVAGQSRVAAQAGTGAPEKWSATVVSVVVLSTFGIVMWATLTHVLPAGSEAILNVLLGTLAAMATNVVGYWVGSSAGSAAKTEMLFRSSPSLGGSRS